MWHGAFVRIGVVLGLGFLLLFLAGFLRGGYVLVGDPELALGLFLGLGGLGLSCVLAAGVAGGIVIARDHR